MSKYLAIISACSFPGCHSDCDELVRLVEKAREFSRCASVNLQVAQLNDVAKHFQPEAALVSFLFDRSQLGDKVGFRFSTTCRAIVRGD